MVSDVDVAWLRSPWPLVRYGGADQPRVQPRCALLALADVVLSVDQVSLSIAPTVACRRHRLPPAPTVAFLRSTRATPTRAPTSALHP